MTPDAADTDLASAIQTAWSSFAETGVPSTTPSWPEILPAVPGNPTTTDLLLLDADSGTGLADLSVTSGDLVSFRGGRCSTLVGLAASFDSDLDSLSAPVDNCPFHPNSKQGDLAGLGAGSSADGTGDVCQCGDSDDDGDVDEDDVAADQSALADPSGAPLSPDGAAKCEVAAGSPPGCDIVDVAVKIRNLELVPLAPPLDNSACDRGHI